MRRQGPHYRVPFRRRREGRTDYRVRQKLLRSGKARAVVRKTINQTIVQVVSPGPSGDRVLASAVSRELRRHGWSAGTGNVPAAYLTGYLAGKRAVAKGIREAVLDLGRQRPSRGGRVFAALRGLVDAGISVPHSEDVLPSPDRLRGAHIHEALSALFDDVKAKMEAP